MVIMLRWLRDGNSTELFGELVSHTQHEHCRQTRDFTPIRLGTSVPVGLSA